MDKLIWQSGRLARPESMEMCESRLGGMQVARKGRTESTVEEHSKRARQYSILEAPGIEDSRRSRACAQQC